MKALKLYIARDDAEAQQATHADDQVTKIVIIGSGRTARMVIQTHHTLASEGNSYDLRSFFKRALARLERKP